MQPARIIQAKNAENNRKSILTRIHRVIDDYEDGKGATACMDQIKQITGRKS